MTWFWAVAEGVVFLGIACMMAVYTGKPVRVFGVFLLLTVWMLIKSARKGGL